MSTTLTAQAANYDPARVQSSEHFQDGQFINTEPFSQPGFGDKLKIAKRFLFEKRVNTEPQFALPVTPIDPVELSAPAPNESAVFRLGHSSILMALNGEYWITDPVFSDRASPVQWAGPKRFHPTPIDLGALPNLKGVIISHDHYDHLDKGTIKKIHPKVESFYVPLGVGQHLLDWGVPQEKIVEFDWWQERKIGDITLVSTPANHFSGRGLFDSNATLWSSWVIKTPQHSLFFSGDTGYFSGFKEIGERYGPFDLTMMENGAYDKMWKNVHMTPEQSLQANIDLKGKMMLPIHNGTFDLAFHAWTAPLERITALAQSSDVTVATPLMGQRWFLDEAAPQATWWNLEQPQVLAQGGSPVNPETSSN